MKYNPDVHHRRSIRLKEYDYAQAGAYFVTICTQRRENLFGKIQKEEMVLNPAGKMVQTVWEELSGRFPDIELDEFIIMPNHVHGIIVFVGAPLVGARGGGADGIKNRADGDKNRADTRPAPTNAKPKLWDIVCAFKSITTDQYILGVKNRNWPPFPGRLWQRNYYEHIIRDENSLNKIREYIVNNPVRWGYDMENAAGKPDGVEEDFWVVFGQKRK